MQRNGPYSSNYYKNVTNYEIKANRRTPRGIAVDDPKGELDLAFIDRMVDETEACLLRQPPMTPKDIEQMQCLPYGPRSRYIDRRWFGVKVAPNWREHVFLNVQVFPCEVDQSTCLKKPGRTPEMGPCACRTIIQDQTWLVTAPDLDRAFMAGAFKGELLRLVTGCNVIWDGTLAACAK